ncbi:GGDEF domain-containing protein [Citromicrobium bathyomarinum]|uniref:GGDEF domain-containing protein n=1 Tax=Citromicrobium bathyomarinum TaxID=72174 RepID=UPI00315A1695
MRSIHTTHNVCAADRVGVGRLFRSGPSLDSDIQSRLYGQLLSSLAAALMGSLCALCVLAVAIYRSSAPIFVVFVVLEVAVALGRIAAWRWNQRREAAGLPIDVSWSSLPSLLWCTLQGSVAFVIMSGGDPVLQVLSATLVMAALGQICARNYPAPSFAMLLLLMMDLPFVVGAVLAEEPLLSVIVILTPPFIFGARQIITTFHETLVASLVAAKQNLHLAFHDSLTGILNRQGMDAHLSRLTSKPDQPMAIISLDLDEFKAINDEYGHGAGDTVLVEVARRIDAVAGERGKVARMGGDEFMVLLRDCGIDEVRELGEKLVEAVCGGSIRIANGVAVSVGASAGFACIPQDALTTHELRIRADLALYDAKDAGKQTCQRFRQPEQDIDTISDMLKEAFG